MGFLWRCFFNFRSSIFGKPFCEAFFGRLIFGRVREVGELDGIVVVIVKFLGSVGVADIAPIFGSE